MLVFNSGNLGLSSSAHVRLESSLVIVAATIFAVIVGLMRVGIVARSHLLERLTRT
jgi:hypothetical protein